jgi:hypothetical protein
MSELHTYIIEARTAGQTDDQIIETLISKGWNNEEIMAAFLEMDSAPQEHSIFENTAELVEILPREDTVAVPPTMGEIQAVQEELVPENNNLTIPISDSDKQNEIRTFSKPSFSFRIPFARQMIFCLVLLLFSGAGYYIYQQGYLNSYIPKIQKKASVSVYFEKYSALKKNDVVLFNSSVRFILTGSQLQDAKEFNSYLQGGERGLLIGESNKVLLIYYKIENTGEKVQELISDENIVGLFSITDTEGKRVDTDSSIFKDSLLFLSDLKPKQYTSNALVFQVPQTIVDSKSLYFVMQSNLAKPEKAFIQL